MAAPPFVHLHTHSEFSLLDGAARLDRLVTQAAHLDMPALALTDHGVMYGALEFYNKCKSAGIKPIVGVEAYVAPGSHRDKSPRAGKNAYHLLLLAKNLAGYRNLLKLTTIAAVDGFYSKPRIDRELLERHREGLIVTSACLGSEVCTALVKDDYESARNTAAWYCDVFGQESYFLELQDHTLPQQAKCNAGLIKIAGELGLKLLCTNDVHYINREDAYAHDVLLCIGTGSNVNDPNRLRYDAEEFYLKSGDEMLTAFRDMPQALEMTTCVADLCDLDLDNELGGRAPMPTPDIPEGLTAQRYLEQLAQEGLQHKLADQSDRYEERLKYELSVIEQTGFAQYILVVRDFALFARKRGIYYGVRGSAAGSLTSFCVDITDTDPVEYGLTFERFLNPERIQMPDIDMDFEDSRRGEVIEYVTQRYGADHVAQIVTFGTLAAKAAIKDAGRALAIPLADVNRVAAMIPSMPLHVTIDRAMAENQDLKSLHQRDPAIRNLLDTARRLEGLSRHSSVHAAGVVISHEPLVEYTPLQRSADGGLVTQYGAAALEQLGLLKMDFLGLINLSILGRAVENIKRSTGVEIDVRNIPLDDHATYELLGRGDTTGIFQLESDGMRRHIVQLKPTSVRDLAAMVALYRPGPMAHIDEFIRGKHGQLKVKYIHECLKPIVEETYGVIVYQDQVMQIAQAVAGYTMGQADILRRAMGKKKPDEMAKQEEHFIQGAARNGIDKPTAKRIFELMLPFAGYAFNKAHAVCYAMVAYQTAYLKANYPVEYMAALLACYMEKTDKVAACLDECRRMGLTVHAPDVNRSDADFSAEDRAIRFGLAAVKNVGRAAVELILAARREGGEFRSLHDFCNRVQERGSVTKATVEALIQCGAFDVIHASRQALVQILESAMSAASSAQRDRQSGQENLFLGGGDSVRHHEPPVPDVPDFTAERKLAFEKDLLGFYISGHPLQKHKARLLQHTRDSIASLSDRRNGEDVLVGGIITQVTPRLTRERNEPFAKFTIEDDAGKSADVILFPIAFREQGRHVRQGAVVTVRGKVTFADNSKGDEEDSVRIVEIRADEVRTLAPNGSGGNGHGHDGPGRLWIRLDEGRVDDERLRMLKTRLKEAPGQAVVCLVIREGKTQYRRRASLLTVEPSADVVQCLKTITGQEVWVEA